MNDTNRKQTATTISNVLAFASFALFFVGALFPAARYAMIMVGIALPWCAVLTWRHYKHELDFDTRSKRAGNIAIPLMVSPMVLAVFALGGSGLNTPKQVIEWGLILALPLWWLAYTLICKTDAWRSETLRPALPCLLLAWIYASSSLALGNRLLDDAPQQVVQTHLLGKYVAHGKGGPSYHFELPPVGSISDAIDLRVDATRFMHAHQGDAVCVGLHPGEFGFPWLNGADCP